jgi:hypothetical protein
MKRLRPEHEQIKEEEEEEEEEEEDCEEEEEEERDSEDVERVVWYEFFDNCIVADPSVGLGLELDLDFLLNLPCDAWQVIGQSLGARDLLALVCTCKKMSAMLLGESFFGLWQTFSDRRRVAFFFQDDPGLLGSEDEGSDWEGLPVDSLDGLSKTKFFLFACGHHVVPDKEDTVEPRVCTKCSGHDFRKSVLRKVGVENAYHRLATSAEEIWEEFDCGTFSIALLSPEAFKWLSDCKNTGFEDTDLPDNLAGHLFRDVESLYEAQLENIDYNDDWYDDWDDPEPEGYGWDVHEAYKDGDEDAYFMVEDYRRSQNAWEIRQEERWIRQEERRETRDRKVDRERRLLNKAFARYEISEAFFNVRLAVGVGGVVFDYSAHVDDEGYYSGVLLRD